MDANTYEDAWPGRSRGQTGRTTRHLMASASREVLHETLLQGTSAAVLAAEGLPYQAPACSQARSRRSVISGILNGATRWLSVKRSLRRPML